jgi:hypothetical protein
VSVGDERGNRPEKYVRVARALLNALPATAESEAPLHRRPTREGQVRSVAAKFRRQRQATPLHSIFRHAVSPVPRSLSSAKQFARQDRMMLKVNLLLEIKPDSAADVSMLPTR